MNPQRTDSGYSSPSGIINGASVNGTPPPRNGTPFPGNGTPPRTLVPALLSPTPSSMDGFRPIPIPNRLATAPPSNNGNGLQIALNGTTNRPNYFGIGNGGLVQVRPGVSFHRDGGCYIIEMMGPANNFIFGHPGLVSPAPSFRSGSSMSSISSWSIHSSSSGDCRCENCAPPGCVCYMYCADHARENCPVHRRGRDSYDESEYGGSQRSTLSRGSGSGSGPAL